ncbi:MAG: DUF2269 domain-containing protein [Steroidobacteraceae bacterium]
MSYLFIKWLHAIGATVLLGTGAGIAFFMWQAHRTRDTRVVAVVAAQVVRADLWFTATAVLLQPITGLALMAAGGWSMAQSWLAGSIVLYLVVGCCWLPVVWLQWRMRDLAIEAAKEGRPLPSQYLKYFRWWFLLGWPGFGGVLLILWLMVSKHWPWQ